MYNFSQGGLDLANIPRTFTNIATALITHMRSVKEGWRSQGYSTPAEGTVTYTQFVIGTVVDRPEHMLDDAYPRDLLLYRVTGRERRAVYYDQ
ncbi:hypothetical protein MFIFM68171_05710 [Madurella fahalii]|uniref:Uncharacterized protein n=1 Tax=Madurella fahalii TaxID=1157608 RepID=A0ABQ0GCL9_9PEZI